ncbi:MAG: fibrobacter succinogenes major paralogous domain-containing protein, partial [Dysgonamonadaceae bacterium]|nr:fibrobacter succinogenes major paralogous domain-containing protein [Dysgonamonadaceae bacterium]
PVTNGVPSNNWTSSDKLENSYSNYGNNNGYALYTSDTWNSIADKACLTDPAAPEPLMFLPAAGGRYFINGGVRDTGDYGIYWSSTVYNGNNGRGMYFYSSYVAADNDYCRAFGFSVRCISEF